jgi:uncharacterized protein YprB with RNaseH-like and TPR domain
VSAAGRLAALRTRIASLDASASAGIVRGGGAATQREAFEVHTASARAEGGRDPRASRVVAALRRLVGVPDCVTSPPLVFDLETTGLGVDAVPFLVGLGGFHADGSAWVKQWQLGDLAGERAMWLSVLDALESVGHGAMLLTFNGASFDRTVVRLRLRRLGLWDDGLAARFGAAHFDLLPVCRRLWRDTLPDVRLVTLEREVLGARRVGDPSGAEIAEIGQRWIDGERDAELGAAMAAARRHNADDLLGLASLVEACAQAIDAPVDLAQALGVARHLERVDAPEGFVGLLEVWRRDAIRDRARGVELLLLVVRGLRRAGEHDEAHAILREICTHHPGHPEATRRLVIDLEHRLRRTDAALTWLRTMDAPCPRRVARLTRKLAAAASAELPPAVAPPVAASAGPVAQAVVGVVTVDPGASEPAPAATPTRVRPRVPGSWRGLAQGPARRAPAV